MKIALLLLVTTCLVSAQRITTIQLDGVQYFVSRMNPYSPELNYFLAYQYCRSLGLQLASFETKEKADTITQYLKNAGYTKYDFWTSGNKLGTDMYLWMSTGLPFNATFDYMRRPSRSADVPPGTEPQRVSRESGETGSPDACVTMAAPTLAWEGQDCTLVKDFICEQTRCYYFNYGSIPVLATQGNRKPYATTTTAPEPDRIEEADKLETDEPTDKIDEEIHETDIIEENHKTETAEPEDPVVGRLMSTSSSFHKEIEKIASVEKNTRPEDIPDITSLFTKGTGVQPRIETVFDGLESHDIRSIQRNNQEKNMESTIPHEENVDYENAETEMPDNGLEDARTIGPYDSVQDYFNDQPDVAASHEATKDQDEESSTILPDAEPAYRYNIKVRSNGKVLDPPSN